MSSNQFLVQDAEKEEMPGKSIPFMIAAFYFASPPGYASSVVDCSIQSQLRFIHHPSQTHPGIHDVRTWLSHPDTTGEQVIQWLSQDKKLAALFEGYSGVTEGYSVSEHTLMVFQKFKEEWPHYEQSLKDILGNEPTALLKMTIALHDIGKPIALKAGDLTLQHHFTSPLLEAAMKSHGFTPAEIEVSKAITGQDAIGEMMKDLRSPHSTLTKLADLADHLNLPFEKFLELQKMFYTIDASSYAMIVANHFTSRRSGKFIFNLVEEKLSPEVVANFLKTRALGRTEPLPLSLLKTDGHIKTVVRELSAQKGMFPHFNAAYPLTDEAEKNLIFKNIQLNTLNTRVRDLKETLKTEPDVLSRIRKNKIDAKYLDDALVAKEIASGVEPMSNMGSNHHAVADMYSKIMEQVGVPKMTASRYQQVMEDQVLHNLVHYETSIGTTKRRIEALAKRIGSSPAQTFDLLVAFHGLGLHKSLAVESYLLGTTPKIAGMPIVKNRLLELENQFRKTPFRPEPIVPVSPGESLPVRQNKVFSHLFPTSGYQNLDEYRAHLKSALNLLKKGDSSHTLLTQVAEDISKGNLEVRLHTRPENVNSILQKGLLNRHEGGAFSLQKSTGRNNAIESSLLNANPDQVMDLPGSQRAIYALLGPVPSGVPGHNLVSPPGFAGFKDEFTHLRPIHNAYGSRVLIYDPKDLEGLTWTMGDSANNLKENLKLNGEPFFRKPEAWDQAYIPWEDRELMIPFVQNVDSNKGFHPMLNGANSLTPLIPHFKRTWTFTTVGNSAESYFEAQIYFRSGRAQPKPKAIEYLMSEKPTFDEVRTLLDQHIEVRVTPDDKWDPIIIKELSDYPWAH